MPVHNVCQLFINAGINVTVNSGVASYGALGYVPPLDFQI